MKFHPECIPELPKQKLIKNKCILTVSYQKGQVVLHLFYLHNSGKSFADSRKIKKFEGACVPNLPSSLPRRARKVGPKLLIARGGNAASGTLKRYVFQDSMRAPLVRLEFGPLFRKKRAPTREVSKSFCTLRHLSSGSALFGQKCSPFESQTFFSIFPKKTIFAREVSSKS